MYKAGTFTCVSFHRKKILGHSRGGAILFDDLGAWKFFNEARRDKGSTLGMHCWMPTDVAAALHLRLTDLPRHNADQIVPLGHYPDLMATGWNSMS